MDNNTSGRVDNNPLVEALIALKPFLSKVEDNSIAISSIDNRLALLIEEVSKLSRILYEGNNGQSALTTRIATIESNMVVIRDTMTDYRLENKETVTRLLTQIQSVDKASLELGIAFDDFQVAEKDRRETAKAKDLVHYGWKLNTIQAILLLLITSTAGFISTELYQYWFKSKPSNHQRMESTR